MLYVFVIHDKEEKKQLQALQKDVKSEAYLATNTCSRSAIISIRI